MSTRTPIASTTLNAATSSVTFANIPQTYTDLVLVVFIPSNSINDDMYLQYNSDTGSNYSYIVLRGNGTNASSTFSSNTTGARFSDLSSPTTTTSCAAIINIMNYANTTTYKTNISRSNNASTGVDSMVTLWRNTAAITSVKVYPASGNMASGSTFNLYGIANASITNTAKATGGDSITTDGTYWYHTFSSSGVFTPTSNITCDYAVVGGGGGGGSYFSTTFSFVSGAGGGGGGGVSNNTAQSFASATAYTVTIGAGATASYGTAGSGTSSSISGGSISTTANGGSGGGNGGPSTVGAGGTAATGGGSGGSGGAFNNDGDAGSNGTNVTWSAYYGGGGGGGSGGKSNGVGGTGGSGGGGVGMEWEQSAFNYAVLPGTANTGGGGGGATQPYPPTSNTRKTGGNGGSGIVIIRYAV